MCVKSLRRGTNSEGVIRKCIRLEWAGVHLTDAARGIKGTWWRAALLSLIASPGVFKQPSLLFWSYLSNYCTQHIPVSHTQTCMHAKVHYAKHLNVKRCAAIRVLQLPLMTHLFLADVKNNTQVSRVESRLQSETCSSGNFFKSRVILFFCCVSHFRLFALPENWLLLAEHLRTNEF